MDGIEAAAEEADAHAGRGRRQLGDAGDTARGHGRVCPVAAHQVLEARELLDADRAARVELAGRDADLAAEAELAAIGELGRGVVEEDRGVDLVEEARDRRPGLR